MSQDSRVLPTWYSDNYFSLLPGETKNIFVESDIKENNYILVSGWNSKTTETEIKCSFIK